jgi:DNA-binding NtrC family response regulator
MTAVWHPPGLDLISNRRLASLGLSSEVRPIDPVSRLDEATAHGVWLISQTFADSAEWPRLRIRLAQAGRLYLRLLSSNDTAGVVEAMRDGAFDVLAVTDTDSRWRSAFDHTADNQRLWLRVYGSHLLPESNRLVGRSQTMMDLRRSLERVGPTDVTVLLLGESGVGKERFAAALHEVGQGGELVTLNCAAIPKDLLEAELFGVEKGAFTGAHKMRPGLVEQAAGGVLFLDEIGEMDLAVQPKLLRFLETRRARRVGGEKEYAVQLRVVAATNRDLETEVRAGRFRADLYYRLAEFVLRIPPLRDRPDDIPDLAQVFLAKANERFGKNIESLEPALIQKLRDYSWPGNVRELKSVIDRLVLFHDGPVLREGWWEPPTSDLYTQPTPPVAIEPPPDRLAPVAPLPLQLPSQLPAEFSLPSRSARMALARQLLTENQLSLCEIAARTGVHSTTLFRWRKGGKI